MTWISALALILCVSPSFAADATLAKISGPVFIRAGGSSTDFPAKGGEELIFGDSVKTGAGAVAHVLIGERGAILVRENSFFTLQGEPQKTTLKFAFGEFLIGLRKRLKRGESFRVRTPSAVASVRGTLFWGKTDEKKTSTYAGFGHTISVTAKGATVLVHAGETTTIPFGAPPAAVSPSQIPMSYMDNFRIDGSLQDLESLADRTKAAAPPVVPVPAEAPAPSPAPAAPATSSEPDAPDDSPAPAQK